MLGEGEGGGLCQACLEGAGCLHCGSGILCCHDAARRERPAQPPLPPPAGAHGSGARYVWTLRLLLEDATGQLDAVLYGSEATAFFEGLAPCDLAANPQQAERVEDRLQVLVGKGCER